MPRSSATRMRPGRMRPGIGAGVHSSSLGSKSPLRKHASKTKTQRRPLKSLRFVRLRSVMSARRLKTRICALQQAPIKRGCISSAVYTLNPPTFFLRKTTHEALQMMTCGRAGETRNMPPLPTSSERPLWLPQRYRANFPIPTQLRYSKKRPVLRFCYTISLQSVQFCFVFYDDTLGNDHDDDDSAVLIVFQR